MNFWSIKSTIADPLKVSIKAVTTTIMLIKKKLISDFEPAGYTVSHEWADNNYLLHLNPLLNIIPEKDEIENHEPLREKWRDDMQLLSDYLDFRVLF